LQLCVLRGTLDRVITPKVRITRAGQEKWEKREITSGNEVQFVGPCNMEAAAPVSLPSLRVTER